MIRGDDEVRASIAAKPVIVPESITIDRGKVFVGSTFLNACERLQISITKAAPRTPTDKPHVERVFAAINSGFTQYLAGYVGPNVVHRGTSPHEEAVWTLAEVQNLLDLWIVAVWQNKPHPGLRHPAMPKKRPHPQRNVCGAGLGRPDGQCRTRSRRLPRVAAGHVSQYPGLRDQLRGPALQQRRTAPLSESQKWPTPTGRRSMGGPIRPLPFAVDLRPRPHPRGVDRGRMVFSEEGFGPVLAGRPAGGPSRRAAPRRHRCRH